MPIPLLTPNHDKTLLTAHYGPNIYIFRLFKVILAPFPDPYSTRLNHFVFHFTDLIISSHLFYTPISPKMQESMKREPTVSPEPHK